MVWYHSCLTMETRDFYTQLWHKAPLKQSSVGKRKWRILQYSGEAEGLITQRIHVILCFLWKVLQYVMVFSSFKINNFYYQLRSLLYLATLNFLNFKLAWGHILLSNHPGFFQFPECIVLAVLFCPVLASMYKPSQLLQHIPTHIPTKIKCCFLILQFPVHSSLDQADILATKLGQSLRNPSPYT